jgi:hypothetical protein
MLLTLMIGSQGVVMCCFLTMVGWAKEAARKLAFLGQCTKDGKNNHV